MVLDPEGLESDELFFEFSVHLAPGRIIRGWIDKTTGPMLKTWLTIETTP